VTSFVAGSRLLTEHAYRNHKGAEFGSNGLACDHLGEEGEHGSDSGLGKRSGVEIIKSVLSS
jgi:hypothetical protein